MKIGDINLVCEGTEGDRKAVVVKPDSSDEKWLCKKIFPKILKDNVIIRLGVLFGESDNTYLLTPEDYERVLPLINKRKNKDFKLLVGGRYRRYVSYRNIFVFF